MSIERQMFINNSTSTISVSITAYETVAVYEMLTSGSVEQVVETHPLGGGSSTTWDLRVPGGAIWGFGVYNGVSYTNPDPTNLEIFIVSGKDPWPDPPPPPPPLFDRVTDYEDRYEDFMAGLGGTRARGE